MRALRVVVVDVDAQHTLEVAAVEDQQPVDAFGADGSEEPLGDGVPLRRPHRSLHDPNPVAAEHLAEGAAVLVVAIADQQAHALVGEVDAEVARLLGASSPGGLGRAAGEPDAPACVCDEEEHVVAA
jgi:hypothetical protein